MSNNINYSNLFSSNKDDIVEDVYLEIMKRMDDKTLLNYCNSHPYNREICNRDDIWLPRINSVPGLNLLLPYRSHYKNLQDFYFNVRKNAQYVIMDYQGDPMYKLDVEIDPISHVGHEITSIFNMFEYMLIDNEANEDTLRIVIRFNNVLDYDNHDDYTIYSKDIKDPQILQYPQLVLRSLYAVATVVLSTNEISAPVYLPPNIGTPEIFSTKVPNVPRPQNIIPTPGTFIQEFLDLPKRSVFGEATNASFGGLYIPTEYEAPPNKIIPYQKPIMKIIEKTVTSAFIDFKIDSLRIIHRRGFDIKLFREIIIGEGDSMIVDLSWIPYGYSIPPNQYRWTLLLIDFDLLGLEPSGYNFVLIPYHHKYDDWIKLRFTTTSEQFLEAQKHALIKVIMSTDAIIFDIDALYYIINDLLY